MSQNTPRGYTYPCFSDPFLPAANIQDLATDIDGDVQSIITNVGDALNTPPTCIATGATVTALGAGLMVGMVFTTQIYDNAAMFTPPSANITIPVEGLYLISYRGTFTGPNNGVRALQVGVGGFIRSMQTRRRAGTSGQITVVGTALTFAAPAANVNLFAGSSVASTIVQYSMSATRMTGTTLL